MTTTDFPNITQIFSDFTRLKVLIIGDVMVDAYTWGKVDRISPEAPVPILSVKRRENRLGGAANVALNIQALGATPLLCGVVGDDAAGENFVGLLKKQGIATEGIISSQHRVTTLKERMIGGAQQLLRVDAESDTLLNPRENADLMQAISTLLPQADVVVFQDYDKGVLDASRIATIIQQAEKHDIPTAVDPKIRNFLHYQGATLFKPNLKELKEGLQPTGFAWPETITAENVRQLIASASEKFRSLTQVKNTLITLSEKGVFIDATYRGKEEKHLLPAHIRQIADVSGAGDTVVSIAALCLALHLPPELLAGLANLGGGLVCESVGVVPIDKSRLIEEAKKHWEQT